jgi:hypothetical protein
MSNEPKEISDGTFWTLFGIALFLDILELALVLLPGVGEILSEFVDWISFGALWWWCKMNELNYPGKNRTLIIGALVGMIPVINDFLPEITLSVWYVRKGYKKQQKALAEQKKNNLTGMQKTQNQQMTNMKKVA